MTTFPIPGEAPYGDKVKQYIDDQVAAFSPGTGDMSYADNLAFLPDFQAARTNLDVPSFAEVDTMIAAAVAAAIADLIASAPWAP